MADEIRQQIGLDASKALDVLTQLEAGINRYNAALGSSVRAMQGFNTMGGKTVSALKHMATDSEKAATQMAKLAKIKLPKTSQAPRIDVSGLNTTQIESVIAAMSKVKKSGKDTSKSWVISWQTMGRVVLTQGIVRALNAIRQALKAAVGGAIDFQKAVAEIATISGPAIGGMSGIADVVKDVADAFNLDIGDTAEAAYQTISNQIVQTNGDLEAFLGTAARFAKITKTDMATSVNLLSGTLNAFGKDVSEAEDVAAKFFKTIELGRTRADELALGLGTISPIAAQLGISMDELNASVATLTIGGIKTDKAITQIRGAMQGFLKATPPMTAALKELGFATGEQILQAHDLQAAIRLVITKTDGSAASISKLFPRIRGLTGVIGLATDANEHFTRTMEEQQTALAETYDRAYKLVVSTDAEKVTKFFNTIKNFFITDIGQRFLSGLVFVLRIDADNAQSALEIVKETSKKILDEETKLSKKLLQVTLGRIEKERQLMGQRAAEARLQFFVAADAAKEANASIVASSTWALDSLMGPINAATDAIKKAAADGRDLMKAFETESKSSLASVQKTLFARAVSTTKDPNLKVALLRKKSAEEAVRSQELAATAVTKAEHAVAKALQASSRAYNDQAFSISSSITKKYENGVATRDLTDRELELQKAQTGNLSNVLAMQVDRWGKAQDAGSESVRATTKTVAESSREMVAYQSEMKALGKKWLELSKTADDADLTPEIRADKAKEAEKAIAEFSKKYKEGVEKFAGSPDELVRGLFQEIQALDTTVEFDTIMNVPTNMREIHGQLQAAFDELFAADPLNVQVKFIAEKAGKDVKTAVQLGQAQDDYSNVLEKVAKDIDKVTISQAMYNKVQTDSIAILKNLEPISGGARKVVRDSEGELRLGGFVKKLNADEVAYNKILANLKRISTEGPATVAEVVELKTAFEELNPAILKIGNMMPWKESITSAFKTVQELARQSEMLAANLQSDTNPNRDNTVQELKDLGNRRLETEATARAQEFLNQTLRDEQALQQGSQEPAQEAAALEAAEVNVTAEVAATNMGIDTMVSKFQQAEQQANAVADATARISQAAASTQGPVITNPYVTQSKGGRVGYYAHGGQGTDTIPAMLSAGETVTNARSSRRFFSQLQAMNAGQKPIYRNDGGDTYNTNVGDINVSGAGNPEQTARVIMSKIRREQRRGSAR